jgi:hypothetical protein
MSVRAFGCLWYIKFSFICSFTHPHTHSTSFFLLYNGFFFATFFLTLTTTSHIKWVQKLFTQVEICFWEFPIKNSNVEREKNGMCDVMMCEHRQVEWRRKRMLVEKKNEWETCLWKQFYPWVGWDKKKKKNFQPFKIHIILNLNIKVNIKFYYHIKLKNKGYFRFFSFK